MNPIVLRYDLRTADESGNPEHPQIVMKRLGYNVLKFRGEPIGDCVFMEVDKKIEPLPEFLTVSNYKF